METPWQEQIAENAAGEPLNLFKHLQTTSWLDFVDNVDHIIPYMTSQNRRHTPSSLTDNTPLGQDPSSVLEKQR